MADDSLDSLYELYDSLTPYEVAILALTSPSEFPQATEEQQSVVLTTKETYLWAGAVAQAFIEDPSLEMGQIERTVNKAVFEYFAVNLRFRNVTEPTYL